MKQKIISFGGPPRKRAAADEQARAAVGKRRRRRRTGRHTLHYLLILLAAVAVGAVLSLTVLFRIEKISVTGTTKYASEEIIAASGIQIGDNLFRASAYKAEKRLITKFPYIEAVKLKRAFPSKLTLEITQAKPLGAADTAAGYVVISRAGRVMEIGADSVPNDVTVVNGMYLYNPRVGQVLGEGYNKDEQEEAEKEKDAFSMLLYLVDAVRETGFERITQVDFSDRLNMMVVYDNRLILELGTQLELPYKLRFSQTVIQEQLEDTFEGVLDVSMAPTAKEIYALPCKVEDELERRKLTATAKTEPTKKSPMKTDPTLEVIPGTEPVGSGASSKASDAGKTETSSEENYLETIPGTALPSSSEASSEQNSTNSASNG